MIANDFNAFFRQHPNIERIFFNGGKAEQVFKQHVLQTLDDQFKLLTRMRLPSTSPAHAAMKIKQKTIIWKHALS